FCANCGRRSDTIKLKNCNACFLVKYCSVDCQKIHRKQHKKACKKRAAELKDEKLYSQGHKRPESDFCPLCLLAISFPMEEHAMFRTCCMKMVCNGCCLAAAKIGLHDACPFCRSPEAKNDDEAFGRVRKRVAAKDPESICHLGDLHLNGVHGMEKDQSRAIELWTEAAELGSTRAHFKLGHAYYRGVLGVAQDKVKGIHCWEVAAMQGDVGSRHFLGLAELENLNFDRAVRHLLISAKKGSKESLDRIKNLLTKGLATKAQYLEGLEGYQDAVEEMKSPDRDEIVTLMKK
ncbi:hypothetical protein THAOC_23934, partial [Thalassiosira oceanica]